MAPVKSMRAAAAQDPMTNHLSDDTYFEPPSQSLRKQSQNNSNMRRSNSFSKGAGGGGGGGHMQNQEDAYPQRHRGGPLNLTMIEELPKGGRVGVNLQNPLAAPTRIYGNPQAFKNGTTLIPLTKN